MLVILFSSALQVQAQIPLPEKVCIGTGRSYWVDGLAGSTFTWKINGVIQRAVINKIDITWATAGIYTLEVQEHQYNCVGDVQSEGVEVMDEVTPIFDPITAVCNGAPAITLPTTSLNGIHGIWTPAFNIITTTEYTFSPIVGQCATSVRMSIPVDPIIIAETHFNIDNTHASGSIDLNVSGGTGPGTYLYNWSNGAITEDMTNLARGTYVVVVTDKSICNKASLTIKILNEYLDYERDCVLFIPEAFSPNGDNIHDFYQIYCINHYPNARIYIFDQWGNKIFEKAHYGNLDVWKTYENAWWCGKPDRGPSNARNELVAPGAYFYVLDLGNGEVRRSFVFVSY